MIIKTPSLEQKNEIKALWKEAFSEDEPFLSWYFDNFWSYKDAIYLTVDNILGGALSMRPYEIILNKKIVNASYICGVSVQKKMRYRGYATALMKEAIYQQIRRREAVSLLIPFNFDFYRKMGYETCYDIGILSLPEKSINENTKFCVRALNIENTDEINKIYLDFCANKNGYNIRDEKAWEYILNRPEKFNTTVLGCFLDRKLCAYAVFSFNERGATVFECVGEKEALSSIFARIYEKHKKASVYLPRCENVPENTIFKPMVMARVTSVALCMKYLEKLPLAIKITDDFIQENNGVFNFGGEKLSDDTSFDILIDIKHFTQYFMGAKSINELLFDKKIVLQSNKAEKILNLHKKENNYINLIMSEEF